MPKAIIADTACLILLDKIHELNILEKLFDEVIVTSVIAEEFGQPLPEWIRISNPDNLNYQTILSATVDKGEASALALAVELKDSLLIIDDSKARKLALQLGLKFTGTLGVIVDAKLSGHIGSIKPIIEKIKATNFRLTPDLEKGIFEKAGE